MLKQPVTTSTYITTTSFFCIFYRPHPKDGEGNVFTLSTPGGGGGAGPAGGGGGGQVSELKGGGVRSSRPGGEGSGQWANGGGGQVSEPTGGGGEVGSSCRGGGSGQWADWGGGVRSVSRPGGGVGQVQLPGGVRSSRGGGGSVSRGGGGVSILRPLAGGMPLAFTQEDFLVTLCKQLVVVTELVVSGTQYTLLATLVTSKSMW